MKMSAMIQLNPPASAAATGRGGATPQGAEASPPPFADAIQQARSAAADRNLLQSALAQPSGQRPLGAQTPAESGAQSPLAELKLPELTMLSLTASDVEMTPPATAEITDGELDLADAQAQTDIDATDQAVALIAPPLLPAAIAAALAGNGARGAGVSDSSEISAGGLQTAAGMRQFLPDSLPRSLQQASARDEASGLETWRQSVLGASGDATALSTQPVSTASQLLTALTQTGQHQLEATATVTGGANQADTQSAMLSTLTASTVTPGLQANAHAAAAPGIASAAGAAGIPVAMDSPQWPAAVGQQVIHMHQRGEQQISLRLNPQELGPLNVTLSVQDQQAQLHLLSSHAPVRAALEAALPHLREALAASGIALGEATVGDQRQSDQSETPGRSPGSANPLEGNGPVNESLAAGDGIDSPASSTSLGNLSQINLYA